MDGGNVAGVADPSTVLRVEEQRRLPVGKFRSDLYFIRIAMYLNNHADDVVGRNAAIEHRRVGIGPGADRG